MLQNSKRPNDNNSKDSVSVRPVKALANTAPLLPTIAIKRILTLLYI